MRKSPSNPGITLIAAALFLVACSGGGGDSSIPPTTPVGGGGGTGGNGGGSVGAPPAANSTIINTKLDATRFLSRASFGGSKSDIAALTGNDAADWISTEFAKPVSVTLPTLLAQPRRATGSIAGKYVDPLYWDHIIGSNDQLRQRMAFALSQIFVYSDEGDSDQILRAYYQDVLINNAFGNYRDLLEDVTYAPAMGNYLTYRGNQKGNPNTGRMPDENYAREILQLFSIGVVELNMDGTPKLDSQGQQIETYSNDDIVGLARVFTGLNFARSNSSTTSDARIRAMEIVETSHSTLEKQFLGTTIPAGTLGDESIRIALDTIFEHPNVAPFMARQLIQRFTQSNPTPEYIQNVATAFETGRFTAVGGQQFGTGQRGDLQATLAAILLEPTLYSEPTEGGTIAIGKVRDPVLHFTHWARAFDVQGLNAKNEYALRDTRSSAFSIGQQAFRAPSVFNFYRPGYIAPGTNSGDLGITVPEFQIMISGGSVGRMNFMTRFTFGRQSQADRTIQTYTPDYRDELALVDSPQALVDHLDDLLTGGRMTNVEKTEIVDILNTLEIRTNTAENTTTDRNNIVHTAVSLVLNSPSYAVTW